MTRGSAQLAALVRILTGVLFIAEGMGKATGKFVQGGFAKSASGMEPESWPFWKAFLTSVVVPHASLFAWVVAIGELLLGIFTRIAAALGVPLLLAILLGQTYVPGSSWEGWITAGLTTKFAILLLLLITAVGYGTLGVDGRRKKIRPGFR